MWTRSYTGLDVVMIPWGTNVFYVLFREGVALVIDPPDAAPVHRLLRDRAARLDRILLTHGDDDHTGGVPGLARGGAPVAQPAGGGDRDLSWRGLVIRALDTPGHRRAHAAYHLPEPAPGLLFSGDCLFAGGCGRLNGLPPDWMFASLRRLAALPPETEVFCGHDYLDENLRFALTVEPANEAVRARRRRVAALRAAGAPVLPSTLAEECATNPFVRAGDVAEFAARRRAKDVF